MQILWKLVPDRDHNSIDYFWSGIFDRAVETLSWSRIAYQFLGLRCQKSGSVVNRLRCRESYPVPAPDCNKRDWCHTPQLADSSGGARKGLTKTPRQSLFALTPFPFIWISSAPRALQAGHLHYSGDKWNWTFSPLSGFRRQLKWDEMAVGQALNQHEFASGTVKIMQLWSTTVSNDERQRKFYIGIGQTDQQWVAGGSDIVF